MPCNSDYLAASGQELESRRVCGLMRTLTREGLETVAYDAHSRDARVPADWWERHQEWDVRRVAEEEAARKKALLRERALQKLSVDEMKALGLV